MDSYTSPSTRPIFRTNQLIWAVLTILETLLIFRFLLKLFGANPAAGFTDFIYDASLPFVSPFLNVFRVTYIEGSVFEWTTLLAMFTYWLIGEGLAHFLVMSRTVSTPEAARRLEHEERN